MESRSRGPYNPAVFSGSGVMQDQMEIVFLGSGTSHGVPMIGCDCRVCRSDDPRDKRFRASVAIRLPPGPPTDGRVILIDISPEFRLAAVACRLERVDAVLFTHGHADHIMGLDDLRRYNNIIERTIPCYADAGTLEILKRCFGYAARGYDHPDRPSISLEPIDRPRDICGVPVLPVPMIHGRTPVLGFRIGRFAYCTDCSVIPESSMALLADLDLLVLDALRYTPHPAHFNLAQALEVVGRLRPGRTLLTHVAHEMGHAEASAKLPASVELAYDGLRATARF